MLTTHFHFRPVRTVQPILIFFWAGSGLLKINTNSGTGMLTYFRRGSGHENEYGSGTVGSGISSNVFSVSEQMSMPEYGYGFFYNLILYCFLILEVYTVMGMEFCGGSESGSGCGTRTLPIFTIFRRGSGYETGTSRSGISSTQF